MSRHAARRLAEQGHVNASAADGAALLGAFGMLIGNTDMHHGNLSFVAEHGRPCELAPACDMTPVAFAPCLAAQREHLDGARGKIARLG